MELQQALAIKMLTMGDLLKQARKLTKDTAEDMVGVRSEFCSRQIPEQASLVTGQRLHNKTA